jgi:hypothetical protein
MNIFYKYLVISILLFYSSLHSIQLQAQNPKIKINYKMQRGMMRAFDIATSTIQNTGGACAENGLEIRVHAQFKSSTGLANGNNASYNVTNTCPSGTCATCITGSGLWSCEQRCEVPGTTAPASSTCGTWINNYSNNASYPGDPGYVDTSSYPNNDILEIQMKGFESDNFVSFLNSDKVNWNYNDGSCQPTCSNGSCYGNYQVPTSGRYTTIDIGSLGNNTMPHKGTNWSDNYDAAYEGTACALDLTGFQSYYYMQWQYRWCWDSTTLNNTHAGLIKIPNTLNICSGSSAIINDSIEAFEAARAFSDYQWQYSTDGTNWINITGATSKDLSTTVLTNTSTAPITYYLRRVGLFCVDFKATASYRRFPVYSNVQQIIVYPQPIAGTLYSATPTNGSTICKGTFVYAQVNSGTGGYTDATDEYEYTINGTNWYTYTPPYGINTSAATSTIKVRTRRTGGSLSGCTASSWSEIASWNISSVSPPTLNTATPINNSTICTPYNVSAIFNAGSGGTSDEFRYSINNGANWYTYTPGNIINTTGASIKILVQGRRIGGPTPCNNPSFTTLAEWTPISTTPINPTLLSKIPNRDSICSNESIVSADFNLGSGGGTSARDTFEVSIDNGTTWNGYISNTNISIVGALDSIMIRGKREVGTSFGCNALEWDTLHIWHIQQLPTGTPIIDKIYSCDASAKVRIDNLIPSSATAQWNRLDGTRLPLNSIDTSFISSGVGLSNYNLKISSGACLNIDIGNIAVDITSITPTVNISTIDNCQFCVVQDGSTRLFFDNVGDLIAEIKDLNVPTTYLDETEICIRINPSQLNVLDDLGDIQPYLRRQWTITPKNNNTNVEVTLYFSDNELVDLRNACLGTPYEFINYDDLMITKYFGGQNGTFTPPKSTVEELINPTFSAFGTGIHQLKFNTNKFSTIYVHPTRGYYAVLPIELIDFSGYNNNNMNYLSWRTAAEINFDRFELEKSKDISNWIKLSSIKGNNSTTQENNYAYIDNESTHGINYYRLKIIDTDESYYYSDIVKIQNNNTEYINIFPNPTNDYINIQSNQIIKNSDIKIFDALGREYNNLEIINSDDRNLTIDISLLNNGVYNIKINSNNYKIIKN